MAFIDQVQLAADPDFRGRVTVAAVFAATQIAGEERASPDHDSYYDKRQVLAVQVLGAPTAVADRFAWAVASNPAVTTGSSDSDIQYTVNSVWDDMAGVTNTERP